MRYITKSEAKSQIPYFQYPKFLLEQSLSQNAKILYMLLYDRARISQKNEWVDEQDRVFVVFPIMELSEKMSKCRSSVKNALKELEDAGWIVRKFSGFSKPKHIYVLVPKETERYMGYMFWGPVGTGKSFLAGCIANALLDQGVSVKMTNFNTILNDLFALQEKEEYIQALSKYELLIIDDFGMERNTEYALENIFSVIDRRCCSERPLIITTNLSLASMKQESNLLKKRIYDRVLQMCVPVKVDGVSRRKKLASDNLQIMKKIIENK